MSTGFVHLHVHSMYSLLDGFCRLDSLAQRAADLGMRALALTDHGVLHGALEWQQAAIDAGIKPIIGCEVNVVGDRHAKMLRHAETPAHLIVLAETMEGYRNLLKIVSASHLDGYHLVPRVDRDLLAAHHGGLIGLSGCVRGEIPSRLLGGDVQGAMEAAAWYRDTFGHGCFYIELNDHGTLDERRVNRALIDLARNVGLEVVATNDVHYIDQLDARSHEMLLAIQRGATWRDPNRWRFPTDEYYLKGPQEMAALFAYAPEAITNTIRIADRCTAEWGTSTLHLPCYPVEGGVKPMRYLRELAEAGLSARYARPDETVRRRLNYELDVIERMEFADYFLVVWDFIRYARDQGIGVGPGRGSAAGSLVAYCLRITDVDPMRHRLLFERFLNPHRVSWPDIDIDFEDERRHEVIRYVTERYGKDRVAQIGTFGTLSARAVIRDVGKVLEVSPAVIDRVAKLIPGGPNVTIDRALTDEEELRTMVERDASVRTLVTSAKALEGLPRHTSVHAAGVVISPQPLDTLVPLMSGGDETAVTQFDMAGVEAAGLLKIDFLGLRTLTLLRDAEEWVVKVGGKPILWDEAAMDDAATYALLSRGDADGCFQMESRGVKQVLRELRPSTFEDIVAVISLYRPGPMDHIDTFIKSKHGAIPVSYPDDALIDILKDTYGIIVYQEQIMQIASRMAGFTLGQADLLRRAVGKKKREVLDEQRAIFVDGCVSNEFSRDKANEVYDLIVRFADYGFNRAHAAAYGVLAYRTAFLKANYPTAFMTALLTNVGHAPHKVGQYVDDCRRMGILVRQPDVNASDALFTVEGEGIRVGLAAVKFVGSAAVRNILDVRAEAGPFQSLVDFCERVDSRLCNRKTIENLIRVGAFDSLEASRRESLIALDTLVGAEGRSARSRNQLALFDTRAAEPEGSKLSSAASVRTEKQPDDRGTDFSPQERLHMERELLGVYVSAHPLTPYDPWLRTKTSHTAVDLGEVASGTRVKVGGMVTAWRETTTWKGERMAFIQCEDLTGSVEVVAFPKVWAQVRESMHEEVLLLVAGQLQLRDEKIAVLADRLRVIPQDSVPNEVDPVVSQVNSNRTVPATTGARNSSAVTGTPTGETYRQKEIPEETPQETFEHPAHLFLRISQRAKANGALAQLQKLLKANPGELPVILYDEVERTARQLSDQYTVSASAMLLASLRGLLGSANVALRRSASSSD